MNKAALKSQIRDNVRSQRMQLSNKQIENAAATLTKHATVDGNPELVICPLFYKGSQPDRDRRGKNRYLRKLVRKIQAEVPVKLMRIDKCGHIDDAKQWRIEEVDFEVGE